MRQPPHQGGAAEVLHAPPGPPQYDEPEGHVGESEQERENREAAELERLLARRRRAQRAAEVLRASPEPHRRRLPLRDIEFEKAQKEEMEDNDDL